MSASFSSSSQGSTNSSGSTSTNRGRGGSSSSRGRGGGGRGGGGSGDGTAPTDPADMKLGGIPAPWTIDFHYHRAPVVKEDQKLELDPQQQYLKTVQEKALLEAKTAGLPGISIMQKWNLVADFYAFLQLVAGKSGTQSALSSIMMYYPLTDIDSDTLSFNQQIPDPAAGDGTWIRFFSSCMAAPCASALQESLTNIRTRGRKSRYYTSPSFVTLMRDFRYTTYFSNIIAYQISLNKSLLTGVWMRRENPSNVTLLLVSDLNKICNL